MAALSTKIEDRIYAPLEALSIIKGNANAIKEFKAGKLEFIADKAGIVHVRFGKASFTKEALFDNLKTLQESIDKNKPSGAKGRYWKTFYVTSTMGPSIQLDINAVQDYQPEG